jgi:hypothetical protein
VLTPFILQLRQPLIALSAAAAATFCTTTASASLVSWCDNVEGIEPSRDKRKKKRCITILLALERLIELFWLVSSVVVAYAAATYRWTYRFEHPEVWNRAVAASVVGGIQL